MANDEFRDKMAAKKFGVEHLQVIYAWSFAVFPAHGLYDQEALKDIRTVAERCHIYIIGRSPKVDFVGMRADKKTVFVQFEALGKKAEVGYEFDSEPQIIEYESHFKIRMKDGTEIVPNLDDMFPDLAKVSDFCDFEVLYIGQAYGDNGTRNAMDRLLGHETLQKISLTASKEGHFLNLLLLELSNNNSMVTMFNPWATDQSSIDERISTGNKRLFEMGEAEGTSLFEAGFIRYFQPHYNKIFKDSFPSSSRSSLLMHPFDSVHGSIEEWALEDPDQDDPKQGYS